MTRSSLAHWISAACLVAGAACGADDPAMGSLDGGGGDAAIADGGDILDARVVACAPDATLGAACVFDADCDDGCFCNGLERCSAGVCAASPRDPCDDGVDCTDDTCDEPNAVCQHAARDELCRDDDFCDGEEVCDLDLGCIDGRPADCDDGDLCTVDRCEPTMGECFHVLRDLDGDGFADDRCRGGRDCNDDPATGASIYPGAPEVCGNAIDDDCDPRTLDVDDRDGDGVLCLDDCADDDPMRSPELTERCTNGIDDDCDGDVDLDDTDCEVTFPGDSCLSPLDVTDTTERLDIAMLRRDAGLSCDRGEATYVDAYFSVDVATVPSLVSVSSSTGGVHLLSFGSACADTTAERLCRAGTPSITETFEVNTAGTYWVAVATAAPSGTLTVSTTVEPTPSP